MQVKNIVIGGTAGGIILLLLFILVNAGMNLITPYDVTRFPGMRGMSDPVLPFFFVYPFVVAYAQAIVFDAVRESLHGTPERRGLSFAGLMLVIMTIPGLYVMATSMTWPVTFYAATVLWEVTGFIATGLLFARAWKTAPVPA